MLKVSFLTDRYLHSIFKFQILARDASPTLLVPKPSWMKPIASALLLLCTLKKWNGINENMLCWCNVLNAKQTNVRLILLCIYAHGNE